MKTAVFTAALLALPTVGWASHGQAQKDIGQQKNVVQEKEVVQQQEVIVGQRKVAQQADVAQQARPRTGKSAKGTKGMKSRVGAKFDRMTSKGAKGTKGTKGTKGVKGGAAELPGYAQQRVSLRKKMEQFVQTGQYNVPQQDVELKAQVDMIRQDMYPEAQTDRQALQWYLQETR